MLKNARMMALLAVCGFAGTAVAQDSVSPTPGLPNTDAVGAVNAGEQCNQFVADLVEIRSTKDNAWGITPMFKLSRVNGSFTTALNSSAVVSRLSIQTSNPAFGSYLFWDTAGPGVNEAINSPATPTAVSGASFQLGMAWTEFGSWGASTNPSYNGVVGGIVNYQASNPNRLYVARTSSAVNAAISGEDRSQFGIGACDASGNIYFRADCGGSTTCTSSGPNLLNSVNEFRVDQLQRSCGVLNVIDNTGADDAVASDWVVDLQPQNQNYNCPSMVPQEIAGRPIMMAANFNREYSYESAPSTWTNTTAHRPGTSDHRGNIGYTSFNFFGGAGVNGVGGVLSKPTGAASPDTDGISLWGIGDNGQPTSTRLITLPTSLTDGCDSGYTYTVTNADEFQHYRSTVGFRGGSNVGLGADVDGHLIVTAYASSGSTNDWPLGYIAGARLDNPSAPAQWGLVAWVDIDLSTGATSGKPFFDETGAQIGRLTTLLEVTGGSPLGPSMSAGAVDAAGNVWFLSAFVSTDAKGNPIPNSANTGLFRAIYDGSNPERPEWCLELVMRNGQQIVGANSDREYKIIFLSIASGSAVASSTLWANDVVQTPWMGADVRATPSDPRNMGGLVLNASLIYDVNQDGNFVSLTGAQGNPASPDQNYNVVLFLAPFTTGGGKITDCNENGVDDAADIKAGTSRDCFDAAGAAGTRGGPNGVPDECECVADWNRDGTANSTDVSDFINTFFADQLSGGTDGDVNCDGTSNSTDVSDFINVWFAAQAGQLPFAGCAI